MFKRIAVIGAGQQGAGIAHVLAGNGFKVILQDSAREALAKGVEIIRLTMVTMRKKNIKGGLVHDSLLDRISLTEGLEVLDRCDLVIDTTPDRLEDKLVLFKKLPGIVPATTILAINSTTLAITRVGQAVAGPERVIGLHFVPPAPLTKLVEIVPGLATEADVLNRVRDFAERLGKETVMCLDRPGHVVHRVLVSMINEAIFTVYEGVASAEDVDRALVLGSHLSTGPLAMADSIGLDHVLEVLEACHRELGDPKYRPCPLLRKYIEAGWLGRKNGRGFFRYAEVQEERPAIRRVK